MPASGGARAAITRSDAGNVLPGGACVETASSFTACSTEVPRGLLRERLPRWSWLGRRIRTSLSLTRGPAAKCTRTPKRVRAPRGCDRALHQVPGEYPGLPPCLAGLLACNPLRQADSLNRSFGFILAFLKYRMNPSTRSTVSRSSRAAC